MLNAVLTGVLPRSEIENATLCCLGILAPTCIKSSLPLLSTLEILMEGTASLMPRLVVLLRSNSLTRVSSIPSDVSAAGTSPIVTPGGKERDSETIKGPDQLLLSPSWHEDIHDLLARFFFLTTPLLSHAHTKATPIPKPRMRGPAHKACGLKMADDDLQQQRASRTSLSISEDLLEEGSTPRDAEPDESALLDSALGVGEDEEEEDGSLRDGDGDLDGEISLLDQEDTKEAIPIEDPVMKLL